MAEAWSFVGGSILVSAIFICWTSRATLHRLGNRAALHSTTWLFLGQLGFQMEVHWYIRQEESSGEFRHPAPVNQSSWLLLARTLTLLLFPAELPGLLTVIGQVIPTFGA
jgi:hypothetical protein